MRTRQIPSGGLAALAVLLAALAVVVVAGARTPLVRVFVNAPRPVSTTTSTTSTTTTTRPAAALHHATGAPHGGLDVPAELATHERITATTTTSAPSTTTTSSTTSTTTTTLPARRPVLAAAPRSGTFEGGATTVVERLGAVHTVTVWVPVGMRVTLSVSCGIAGASISRTTTATVHIVDPASTCVATIRVPRTAPEPATWHLAAR